MEEERKICSLCKQEKAFTEYYKYKTGKPWAYCRSCHYEKFTKARKYAWDQENPERRKEIQSKAQKKWIKKNRERWNELQRESYKRRKAKQDGNKDM